MFQTLPGVYEKKKRQTFQRQLMFFDTYHDYILDEVELRDNIEYERQMHNDDK